MGHSFVTISDMWTSNSHPGPSRTSFAETSYPFNQTLVDFAESSRHLLDNDGPPQVVDLFGTSDERRRLLEEAGWIVRIAFDSQNRPSLILGFDHAARLLGETDALERFLATAIQTLSIGGHVVFQVYRRVVPQLDHQAVVAAMHEAGFLAAWPASPVFIEHPFYPSHDGAFGLYVGRKDLDGRFMISGSTP